MIRQGEIYWVDFGEPRGSAPAYRRPAIIVQNDAANGTAIKTTVVCVITTSEQRAVAPGNVTLEKGEGGLPHRSVVNVSQIATIDKASLDEWIGMVLPERTREILNGLWRFLVPTDAL